MRKSKATIILFALWLLCGTMLSAAERPEEWAQPIVLEGVKNLYRISPLLYRSAQPAQVGMRNLERLGVKTVINLRSLHSDKHEIEGTSLLNPQLHILTWKIQDQQVIQVLKMLRRPENGPFLIHCQHGADRTGLMSAMYRIIEQGWTKEAAIREMIEGGYGYHPMWRNIIRYIEQVDVEKIRKALE